MDKTTQVWVFQWQAASALPCEVIPTCITVQVKHVQLPVRGNLFAEGRRLPKVVSSIEEEDQEVVPDLRSHVQQRHGLGLERGTQGNLRPESIHSPLNDLLRSFGLELFRELLDLQWHKHPEIIPVIISAWIRRLLGA